MKFSDFPYHRPDLSLLQTEFDALLSRFEAATNPSVQDELLVEINRLRQDFESLKKIARIRHTQDTRDPFYRSEQEFFDREGPVYQGLVDRYYRALLESTYRDMLEQKWGSQLFRIAGLRLQTFDDAVIPLLQDENLLQSEYQSLVAQAEILFKGDKRNLQQLTPFQLHPDRMVRKEAYEARYAFFADNAHRFDEIFDQLVKVRGETARRLGFRNFTGLAYARLCRSDYDEQAVASFRSEIYRHAVPAATRLKERQRRRLQLPSLKFYDDKLVFAAGNPGPKGNADTLVAQASVMYTAMGPESEEFFTLMREAALLDLQSKKGKAVGGYCQFISKYKTPFIFANFNGTTGDVDVLTHEAGHALQCYLSRHYPVPEYHFPTYEACEIHSMTMEFLAWPWLQLFFGTEADRYRYYHLSQSVAFLPYAVTVDEFQHLVYDNPQVSPRERKRLWRQLEQKYLPHLDNDDNAFLREGGFWQQQPHIYLHPFYYIDYALAQICALQFWQRAEECREETWRDYLQLSRLGGSLPFLELVAAAGLSSPFAPGSVQKQVESAEAWLVRVPDEEL